MTTNFISVEELTTGSVGFDLSKYTPVTLSGIITRATAKAEKFLGYTLPSERIVNEKTEGQVDPNRDIVVFPKKIPVTNFEAMTIRKGTFSATVTLTDGQGKDRFDIPERADVVYVNGDVVTFDSISIVDLEALRLTTFFTEITYTAGFQLSDRPQDIVDAITLLSQDELTRSLNTSGAAELRQGGVTIKYANQTAKDTHKSDKVLDAEAILTTYKRFTNW